MNSGYFEVVSQASLPVQELANHTKALILEIMTDAVELAWPKQSIISYGIGPKKISEHFCYIGVFKEHINLGFYYGAELPDPQNLLQGSGKLMRHIKILSTQQIDTPSVRQLVEEASMYLPKLKS